ncbi:MAG: retropepsin-like aspartic protease [Flavobacterium sp.]
MKKIKLNIKISNTLHIYVKGKLNQKKAIFLIDTGASNSCISTSKAEKYNLVLSKTATKAAGAGAINIAAQLSNNNSIEFGKYKINSINLVVFDMHHIDQAIEIHDGKPIDGILGADFLIANHAILNYSKNKIIFKK